MPRSPARGGDAAETTPGLERPERDTLIISIAGRPGSGKSTVARALAARLGLDHVSAGDFMRDMASERGISVLELGALAEDDPSIDRAIDERSREFGRSRRGFIIDARLAWHFIPHSIKVFLDVTLEVAAARIYGDHRGSETENVDLAATIANTDARRASESKRYLEYYGIDYLDPTNYDIVLDTSELSIDEVVDELERRLGALRGRRDAPRPGS